MLTEFGRVCVLKMVPARFVESSTVIHQSTRRNIVESLNCYKKRELNSEVDRTGSGSCAVAGFGISGVEPSGSATRELVN